LLSFDDEFVGDVDVGDLDDVGAYAFNGAIYKDIVAATPTINIFCLFNLFVKLRSRSTHLKLVVASKFTSYTLHLEVEHLSVK
jgi:hypothetical protein